MPEVCTVAKAALFEEDVAAVGADRLCSEVWWTTEYPYVSSISGESCEEIGQQWLKLTKDSYVSALAGYDYANVEILYQILKEAKSLDIEKLCAAADTLDTETVIGRVRFNEQHYSVPGRRHSAGVHYYSGICQLLHMPEHDVPFPLPALVRTTTATAARGSAIRRSLFFS